MDVGVGLFAGVRSGHNRRLFLPRKIPFDAKTVFYKADACDAPDGGLSLEPDSPQPRHRLGERGIEYVPNPEEYLPQADAIGREYTNAPAATG